ARNVVTAAVAVIDETVGLVVTGEADVVTERTVGGRSADLDARLLVVVGIGDAEIRAGKARERPRLNHLVDEARGARGGDRGGSAAGVHLQLLKAETRFRRRVVVIEGAVDRNAVVLVAGVVRVLAADVRGVGDPADAALRHLNARNGRHGRVRVIEIASAP